LPSFFALTGAVGLSFLQFCNLNSFRTKFILGFSVFMGLSVPQYFNEYTSVAGYGPVHTSARWVCKNLTCYLWILNQRCLSWSWWPTFSFAVQWHHQCYILIKTICRGLCSVLPG